MDTVYKEVVDGVINSCKGIFAEEGVEEQVLDELKQIWEEKVRANTKEKTVEKSKPNWGQKVVKPNPVPNINAKDETQASSSGVTQVTKIVPIQVKLPPSATQPARKLCINVPSSSLQNNRLQKLLTGSIISSTLNLPADVATAMLQEHINLNMGVLLQIDGTDDDSSEDDDDESLTEEEGEDEDVEVMQEGEDDPLNSDDDVSEEDMSELYETDNIVVCQYDKIGRSRNKWRLFLKDGILHTKDAEYPFQKATGEAEW